LPLSSDPPPVRIGASAGDSRRPDMTTNDPVAAARRIVEHYLELSMVPDPVAASQYLAPDFRMVFTGGRRFSGPADSAAFNAKRYKWVKKRFLRTDAALDSETGDVHVYNTGYLYGEWPDGAPFETNRYIDIFVVRDGLITRTDVWNDSAEIRLAKAGLAEAPL
jgi:ketosteroid isomerase-like protein